MSSSPMTYLLDGRQYVVVASDDRLMAFGLPEKPSGAGEESAGR